MPIVGMKKKMQVKVQRDGRTRDGYNRISDEIVKNRYLCDITGIFQEHQTKKMKAMITDVTYISKTKQVMETRCVIWLK